LAQYAGDRRSQAHADGAVLADFGQNIHDDARFADFNRLGGKAAGIDLGGDSTDDLVHDADNGFRVMCGHNGGVRQDFGLVVRDQGTQLQQVIGVFQDGVGGEHNTGTSKAVGIGRIYSGHANQSGGYPAGGLGYAADGRVVETALQLAVRQAQI